MGKDAHPPFIMNVLLQRRAGIFARLMTAMQRYLGFSMGVSKEINLKNEDICEKRK